MWINSHNREDLNLSSQIHRRIIQLGCDKICIVVFNLLMKIKSRISYYHHSYCVLHAASLQITIPLLTYQLTGLLSLQEDTLSGFLVLALANNSFISIFISLVLFLYVQLQISGIQVQLKFMNFYISLVFLIATISGSPST